MSLGRLYPAVKPRGANNWLKRWPTVPALPISKPHSICSHCLVHTLIQSDGSPGPYLNISVYKVYFFALDLLIF